MRLILTLLLIIIPVSINANAQTQTFTKEGVEYVLELPLFTAPLLRRSARLENYKGARSVPPSQWKGVDLPVSCCRLSLF